ncbi:hypothetical protein AB0B13_00730 [Streptomyces sp. NPDC042898]|uniref:hypothetical protein n=1 Tax=Streptomyces sp. NPDC042898 TaxID=3154334 RepID=UPI0033C62C04
MDEAQLRRELREVGLAHQPDHARMLARVERGLAAPPKAPRRVRAGLPWTGRRWTAAVAVAVAVAGVVGVGGLAVTTLDRGPAAPASRPPAPGPVAEAAGSLDPGSNRWWAQGDVTVTTRTPVSGLVVGVRVARTAGVVSTGHWRTRPAEDFTVTVTEEPGALLYRWTLKPGRSVPPGRHVFAVQYNHAEGVRDASADTYTVVLTGGDGGRSTLRGGFGATTPAT